MRTQEEIVLRIQKKSKEFLNFESEVLYDYLDYDHAEPLKLQSPMPDREQFEVQSCGIGGDAASYQHVLTEAQIPEQMAGYMRFAWGKVEDHRGISAGRSVQKLAALAWLLGDDDVVAFAENEGNYAQYGAPILKHICEKYGLPIPDDAGLLRMMEGSPCEDGCGMGCSS